MGTRKQPKTKAKKPEPAKSATAAKPKAVRSKAPAGSTVTAKAAAAADADADAATNAELRIAMIERAAYLRAEQRGFEPGRELDDWLAAAADIDAQLERRGPS